MRAWFSGISTGLIGGISLMGWLCTSAAFADSERQRVIVEFAGSSKMLARPSQRLHQQFRLDLDQHQLSRRMDDGAYHRSVAAEDLIAAEFNQCFQGAALNLSLQEAEALLSLPYVRAIHEDGPVVLQVQDAAALTLAREALQLPFEIDATGIKVGVIDTGVDYRHPDLGGAVGEGNIVVVARDLVGGDGIDTQGHGTHIAGTIAAQGDHPGIAPGASIYSYRTSEDLGSLISKTLQAMELAYADGVHILNMSLSGSGGEDNPLNRCAEWLFDQGVLVVASAGNSGRHFDVQAPAMSPKVLAVGASTKANTDPVSLSGSSSKGPVLNTVRIKPDLIAPGDNILAQAIGGSGLVGLSGTSMSTPVVAGLAALYKAYRPEAGPAELMAVLTQGAEPVALAETPSAARSLFSQGFGLANVVNSLEAQTWVFPPSFSPGLITPDSPAQFEQRLTLGNHWAEQAACTLSSDLPSGVSLSNPPASLSVPAAAGGQAGTAEVELVFDIDHAAMTPLTNVLEADLIEITLNCLPASQPADSAETLRVVGSLARLFRNELLFGPDVQRVMLVELDPVLNRTRQLDLFDFEGEQSLVAHTPSSDEVQYLALIYRNNQRPLLVITERMSPDDGAAIDFYTRPARHLQPQIRWRDGSLITIPMSQLTSYAFAFGPGAGALYSRLLIDSNDGFDVALAPGAAIDVAGGHLITHALAGQQAIDVFSYVAHIDHQTEALPIIDSPGIDTPGHGLNRRYQVATPTGGLRVARIGVLTPAYAEDYGAHSTFLCPNGVSRYAFEGEVVLTLHAPVMDEAPLGAMNYFALLQAEADHLDCGAVVPFDQDLFAAEDLNWVTAGLVAMVDEQDAVTAVQYPHISFLHPDAALGARYAPIRNPALAGMVPMTDTVPHPKLLFRQVSPGFGVAGYFYTAWDDLPVGQVSFERFDEAGQSVSSLTLPNYQRNLPFSDQEALNSLFDDGDKSLTVGESLRVTFSGFSLDGMAGQAQYDYHLAGSTRWQFNPLALNRLATRPCGAGQLDYQSRFGVGECIEVFFEVLGAGLTLGDTRDDAPGISSATAFSVALGKVNAEGDEGWQSVTDLQVENLGLFQGKLGPQVTAVLPAGLAAGRYRLAIEVEDDEGNRMRYEVSPAVVVQFEDEVFQDRFER